MKLTKSVKAERARCARICARSAATAKKFAEAMGVNVDRYSDAFSSDDDDHPLVAQYEMAKLLAEKIRRGES